MNKVNGKKTSFAPIREDGSRITICYGLNKLSGDLYEWFEVYLPKKQTSTLSLQIVKDAIIADINARTDEKIISGFVWPPKAGGDAIPVWLSTENQFNFKSAYDLAVQKQGATLPVTFKMGEKDDCTPIYHTFETMADAEDFYLQAVGYINQCLAEGWQEKDSIDWTPYEDYFKPQA
jgi:hypothetical protein